MQEELDFDLVITALAFTRTKFQDYQDCPSYEFKQGQIERVDKTLRQIRSLRDKMKRSMLKETE